MKMAAGTVGLVAHLSLKHCRVQVTIRSPTLFLQSIPAARTAKGRAELAVLTAEGREVLAVNTPEGREVRAVHTDKNREVLAVHTATGREVMAVRTGCRA
jgi:ribosomal protein L34